MPTYRYDPILVPVTKTVPCRTLGCKKKVRRSTTFSQTISPFNTNTDGTTKTPAQALAELRAEADAWHPRNDICPRCAETATTA